jgi:UDP-glucose 4-epimerase
MRILLTGGLGYIGSHTTLELLHKNYEVCIIDNLSNSELFILTRLEELSGKKITFIEMDVCNKSDFEKIDNFNFEAVIHFAARKSVSESIHRPVSYY